MITEPESDVARSRRGPVVTALLLALVVLAGCWWATHPDRFAPVGNRIGTGQTEVGSPLLFGVMADPSGEVDLRTVRARVTENTAGARVRVLLCDYRELIGALGGPAETTCTAVLPVAGGTLPHFLSEINPQLVLEVTPRRPGRVVIDGVDLSYRSGLRWGWETAGTVVDVTSPPAAVRPG